MSVLWLFLDGVGLGPSVPDSRQSSASRAGAASPTGTAGRGADAVSRQAGAANPFAALRLPAFERLAGGQRWTAEARPVRRPRHTFVPVDATLGVAGLPQSGTGQGALFTGENAARANGRHFGPYPPTKVRPLVEARSVFAQGAAEVGAERLAFANAYPERFFRAVEARGRWTVTTLAASAAGVRLRGAADLAAGRALAADLTGEGWRRLLDPSLSPISEVEAARRLLALTADHAFVLQEYFLTDKAGHSQDLGRAADVLRQLDRLLAALLDGLGDADLLVVSSDHGNLEDLGTKGHTRHPVPLAAWGAGADAFAGATSILDVTPAVVRVVRDAARA